MLIAKFNSQVIVFKVFIIDDNIQFRVKLCDKMNWYNNNQFFTVYSFMCYHSSLLDLNFVASVRNSNEWC